MSAETPGIISIKKLDRESEILYRFVFCIYDNESTHFLSDKMQWNLVENQTHKTIMFPRNDSAFTENIPQTEIIR